MDPCTPGSHARVSGRVETAARLRLGQVVRRPGRGPPCGPTATAEHSVDSVLSAVAAGRPTISTVAFVPPEQRGERTAAPRQAGASTVVTPWRELADLLL